MKYSNFTLSADISSALMKATARNSNQELLEEDMWMTYQDYQNVNDILIEFGIQAGETRLCEAITFVETRGGQGSPLTTEYMEWIKGFHSRGRDELRLYACCAASLSYRYFRKKKKKLVKKTK